MLNFYAKDACGCCTTKMLFNSEESAAVAFRRAGLSNSASIVDDVGEEHEGIDTFFGFTLDPQDAAKRGFEYLVGAVTGSVLISAPIKKRIAAVA